MSVTVVHAHFCTVGSTAVDYSVHFVATAYMSRSV